MNTIEKIQKHLEGDAGLSRSGLFRSPLPAVECADGFTVSVQAGRTLYCSPRDNVGPWHKLELGFPSHVPNAAILKYAEDSREPTATVYGWVPIELVAELLDEHGGIKENQEKG